MMISSFKFNFKDLLTNSFVILIGSISGSSAFELNTNIEIPEGERRVTKAKSSTNKKGSTTKESNITQPETETSETDKAQSTSKDDYNFHHDNLDCTKKGFDRQ